MVRSQLSFAHKPWMSTVRILFVCALPSEVGGIRNTHDKRANTSSGRPPGLMSPEASQASINGRTGSDVWRSNLGPRRLSAVGSPVGVAAARHGGGDAVGGLSHP